MKIRSKVLTIIAISLAISAIANFIVLKDLVFPSFVKIETNRAVRDAQRAIEAIKSEIDDISVTLWDYSNWNDSYQYVKGHYKDYPSSNLVAPSLHNLRVDYVEVINSERRIIFSGELSANAEAIEKPRWTFKALDTPSTDFTDPQSAVELVSGIINTPDGPLIFGSRPVLHTDGSGSPAGRFIFGRHLDDALIAALKRKLKIDAELLTISAAIGRYGEPVLSQTLATLEPVIVPAANDDVLVSLTSLVDYTGKPVLILKSQIPRNITDIGRRVVMASVVGLAVAGLLAMALTAGLMHWLLVGPLMKLTQHVVAIGTDATLSRRFVLDRSDELGVLSREFDRMLGSVAEARGKLLDMSYSAGVSEMASGVLHNLRNQLTPLSMRLGRLQEHLGEPAGGQIDTALQEMANDTVDPERRRKIGHYIALCLNDIANRETYVRDQVSGLSSDLMSLVNALRDLDRFSQSVHQPLAVSLGSAVHATADSLPVVASIGINFLIAPDLDDRYQVLSSDHILKHVLRIIMTNAIEAIVAAGKKEGRVRITAACVESGERQWIDLSVADDGIGIPPENITAIFRRGFTTKLGERRSIGLHWCANIITAMGGDLRAESTGVNGGTTFHLRLQRAPVTHPEVA